MTVFLRTRRPTLQVVSEAVAFVEDERLAGAGSSSAPPSGDEPIFNAASGHVSRWSETWESYNATSDALAANGGQFIGIGSAAARSLQTSGDHNGTRHMRFTYSGSAQEDIGLEDFNGGSVPTGVPYIVTFYIRTSVGYVWTNPSGNTHKLLLLNTGFNTRMTFSIGEENLDPPMPAYGTLGDQRPSISWFLNSYQYPANLAAYGSQVDAGDFTDGAWHRFTMRLTPAPNWTTAGTVGTGRMELWMDGVKVTEYLGDDNTRPEYNICPVPNTAPSSVIQFPTVKNAATSSQWIEFGDLRIWTES